MPALGGLQAGRAQHPDHSSMVGLSPGDLLCQGEKEGRRLLLDHSLQRSLAPARAEGEGISSAAVEGAELGEDHGDMNSHSRKPGHGHLSVQSTAPCSATAAKAKPSIPTRMVRRLLPLPAGCGRAAQSGQWPPCFHSLEPAKSRRDTARSGPQCSSAWKASSPPSRQIPHSPAPAEHHPAADIPALM